MKTRCKTRKATRSGGWAARNVLEGWVGHNGNEGAAGGGWLRWPLAINLAAVPDANHEHYQCVANDLVHDAIMAYAQATKPRELALERAAGVRLLGEPIDGLDHPVPVCCRYATKGFDGGRFNLD